MGEDKVIQAYKKGYRTTKDGNVIGVRGEILSLDLSSGYKYFSMKDYFNKVRKIRVHRLVAYEKFGDKIFKENIEVRHLNNDRINNSWYNIDIGTASQNMNDRPKEVRYNHAKKASLEAQIHEHKDIIDYYNLCRSYKNTMNKFDISSKGTLHYIINKSEASQNLNL